MASTRPGTFNFEPTVIRMLSPRYMAVAGRSSEFEIFDIMNKRVRKKDIVFKRRKVVCRVDGHMDWIVDMACSVVSGVPGMDHARWR